MVDLELDTPLEAPPLKPPLANSSSPKDNEPDDLDKIRKWQEERLSRKLRGDYESAVLHLNEVVRIRVVLHHSSQHSPPRLKIILLPL
jgi:hypothetical protein